MATDKKATRTTTTTTTTDDGAPVTALATAPASNFGMRKVSSREEMADAFRGRQMAPRFVTLEEGDLVEGAFVRFGRVQLGEAHKDRVTGEYKVAATVIVDIGGGARLEFLAAHELDRGLGRDPVTGRSEVVHEGDTVTILRGKDERVGPSLVTRYIVGITPLPRAAASVGGDAP